MPHREGLASGRAGKLGEEAQTPKRPALCGVASGAAWSQKGRPESSKLSWREILFLAALRRVYAPCSGRSAFSPVSLENWSRAYGSGSHSARHGALENAKTLKRP